MHLRNIFSILNNSKSSGLTLSKHTVKTVRYLNSWISRNSGSEGCARNTSEKKYARWKKNINIGVLELNNSSCLTKKIGSRDNLTANNFSGGYSNSVRFYNSDYGDLDDTGVDNETDADEEDDAENIKQGEKVLQDEMYNQYVNQYCSLRDGGHSVFILQIEVKGPLRKHNTSPGHLQLAENVALVHSIPRWTVVDAEIVKVKDPSSTNKMYSAFRHVAGKIRHTPGISAVFISRNFLPPEHISMAQKIWNLPVFVRSFIVMQVFKAQAASKEAKLHVALAELYYLRFCIVHGFQPDQDVYIGKKNLRRVFHEREKKIKAALTSLEKQRLMVRKRRSKHQIPTIAVIGYTNCGKTTIIKALTGDKNLIPQDKLFATLDVSAHGGVLPNNMNVLYVDTVGFLTDSPVSLESAFTATLEGTINADLVVHVRDSSHPDVEAQKTNVIYTIEKLLPKDKLDTMIEVFNKVDKIDESERAGLLGGVSSPDAFCVSAVTGEGMDKLIKEVQDRLLQNIDFLQKKIKIPQNGPHFSWLYKEATVVSTETDDSDPESLIVNIYISKPKYGKFLAYFTPQKKSRYR